MYNEDNSIFHYLPISKYNIELDLYLTGVGRCVSVAGGAYPPKGHPDIYDFKWQNGRVLPEYQVIYISEGKGIFESSDTGIIELSAGDSVLLFPGIWHRYKPDIETGWVEHWISWNGEYLYRIYRREVISPKNPVYKIYNPEKLRDLYDNLLETVDSDPANNSHCLAAKGLEILSHAIESERDNDIQQDIVKSPISLHIDDHIVSDALQIIWSHSYRSTNVEALADRLPVSRRTLERKFIRTLGHSISSEITRCRLERAKHLLSNTRLPIEHIALAVGFSGSDRMGKVFKKTYAMTPGQYRQNFSEE